MRRQRRFGVTATGIVLLGLLAAAQPAAAAIQLIHMRNGRVLKAESVQEDGDWLMATLEGGNTIGFPLVRVAKVEEDPLGREDAGAPLNVVTSGRELPPRASFPSANRTSSVLDRSNAEAVRAARATQAAQQAPAAVAAGQQEPEDALEAAQQQNPGAQAGTVNLGASRRNRRLGLRTRDND